ncbi:MAG: M23 family metallopeptidase [Pigmentiphaga sp.]|nr:M23 family metallopeptidase [Pigmentiphaga sp.]
MPFAARPASARKTGFAQRFLIVAAVGLFGAAAAVGMVSQNVAEPMPTVEHIAQTLPLPQPLQASPDSSLSDLYIFEERIQQGDSVASMLSRLGVRDGELQRFLVQDSGARSIYKLYPGRAVQVATDDSGQLQWMRYVHTPGTESDGKVVQQLLEVLRTPEGFVAEEQSIPAERHIKVGVGTIRSSLFGATDAAGVPYHITLQMVDILSSDIDFFRDLRSGDQFRVVYETYTSNGMNTRAGRVLALEFVNNGKAHQAVWFDPEQAGASGGYYAFDGSSNRRAFLRVPLEFTRVSSGFGLRRHPVLNTMRGHKGIDYAAPTGTPIRATADGVVESVGSQRGYGNTIVLKHHGKYTTLYAHMSRFAKGVSRGSKVSQGDVIGYVGATGMATGPHLHYEFRVAGNPIDPQSADIPVARSLEGDMLQRFHAHAATFQGHLAMLTALQVDQEALRDSEQAALEVSGEAGAS